MLQRGRKAGHAVVRHIHREAFLAQALVQVLRELGFVFDHEQLHAALCGPGGALPDDKFVIHGVVRSACTAATLAPLLQRSNTIPCAAFSLSC
ncbi:hypothetical protein GCM10007320_10530 [Pseudorhodoferax aquiterrae]|uniref:Uncharacterized protein n=1 Tax=Pseudorhodoferax aquiterrae TaxID=747304 RepID=A0ABQ3FWX2_9BURK|nr:hypothetical protein GCM10007320_10530 [Pseudorhodoferax aquiterrae]